MTLPAKLTAARAAQWQRPVQPRITLDLPFPVSVNHIWKRGGKGKGYLAPHYVLWKRVAGYDINRQKPGCIDGKYHITLTLGRPDKRKRDQDNLVKVVGDLLVEHHVVQDDSLAVSTTIKWSEKIEGCRVVLRAAA